MKVDYTEYSLHSFAAQFKKAREYRGEAAWQSLARNLAIDEKCLLLLETGEMQPDIVVLLLLANCLKLDLCYFFLHDANPVQFDLNKFQDDFP